MEVIFRHLLRGVEENHEKTQSGSPLTRQIFEPSTSTIQAYSVVPRSTCSMTIFHPKTVCMKNSSADWRDINGEIRKHLSIKTERSDGNIPVFTCVMRKTTVWTALRIEYHEIQTPQYPVFSKNIRIYYLLCSSVQYTCCSLCLFHRPLHYFCIPNGQWLASV